MDRIEATVNRLPHYYNRLATSQVYNLIKAFTDEFEIQYNDYIKRLDNSLGIATTNGADLDWRWGSILKIPRVTSESDEAYRKRLMAMTSILAGGTAQSIKFAIAVFLGIYDTDQIVIDDYIQIYDGWEYDGIFKEPEMDAYGHVVAIISFAPHDEHTIWYEGIEDDLTLWLAVYKAAGVYLHVVVRYTSYQQLGAYTYGELASYSYDAIRKWGIS